RVHHQQLASAAEGDDAVEVERPRGIGDFWRYRDGIDGTRGLHLVRSNMPQRRPEPVGDVHVALSVTTRSFRNPPVPVSSVTGSAAGRLRSYTKSLPVA